MKKSATTTPDAGPRSCSDYLTPNECDRDANCTTRYGEDAATADELFMACMPTYPTNLECNGERACYTHSSGQRAIARKCDYPRWTEVECTAEEIAPCQYTTVAACAADQRCSLNTATDLASKESIAMGCGYKKAFCGAALSCYNNKLTGARVMANSLCETPFPEWEYSPCTPADSQARKIVK